MPPLSLPRKLLISAFCATVLAFGVAAPAQAEEEKADDGMYASSGLPVPRFISLKFEEVNLRTGPGTRYPIRWVYKRKHMPVEVVEEYGQWRKLRDIVGDEGWAHQSQLSGTRTAVGKQALVLKRYPEDNAPPMIKVDAGVVMHLLECDIDWCEVQIQSYKAWIEKRHIWGVYPRELL